MRKIDIVYKVWWWPWSRRVRGRVPSSWEELDTVRFLAVVRALLGQVDDDEYLAQLCGIPVGVLRRLDDWQRYQIEKLVEWIGTSRPESSRMFIRRIEGLHAPADGLGDMTLQQFMTVDTFFGYVSDSMKEENAGAGDGVSRAKNGVFGGARLADGRHEVALSGDIGMLCQFVAALYMRRGERYQVEKARRTIFDLPGQDERLVDIDGNARMLERRADRVLLWGAYFNWLLVKAWLARAFPLLFPEGDDDGGGRVRNAWLNAFDSFVGDDVAHLDDYRSMSCTDAFRIMQRRIKNSLTK